MTFESRYLPGSVVGGKGSEEITPIIHLKSGKRINDICVGFQICTENKVVRGETISDCLTRHGVQINDVEKVVVSVVDMMTTKVIRETFSWTPNEGWKQESYQEC